MTWLFFIVLIDAIGFGIVLPLLPIMAFKYNFNAFELGFIASAFSFCQFLFSPILGALSDRFGRKFIIVGCLFVIGVSYHVLAIADTFYEILLARVLAGIFTGNISVVMASASDLSNEENRAKYMAYIGGALGIGFMLGPILGGFLAGNDSHNVNLKFVFNIASVFTLFAGFLSIFFLKETLVKSIHLSKFNPYKRIKKTILLVVSNKQIVFLIYLSAFTWFSFSSIQIFLTAWSVAKYDLSPFTLGIIGTTFAFIYALVQIISTKYITGGKAILIGFYICTIATFGMLSIPNQFGLSIIVISLAIGLGFLFPNLNSTISLYGSNTQRGFIIGLSQSAGTLGQSIGPLIVGFAYTNYNHNTAWVIIGTSFIAGSILTLKYMLNTKKILH